MSVEVVHGGRRRIDRVLDPRFVAGVGQLDLAELRSRREEADISYLRRLLQGRLDIQRVVDLLRGELAGRCRDASADAYLVKPFSSLQLLAAVRRLVAAEAP